MTYFAGVQREGGTVDRSAWREAPSAAADPHRDVTGALHDVSNALTVILGWIAEVRSGRGPIEQTDRALAIVEHQARSARDLARRAIGAHNAIESHEASLDAIVDDAVEALAVEADRVGLTFRIASRCPTARVLLAADASQVLTNVLLNALSWGPRGTSITVTPSADAASVSVLVQDQGPGVPAAQVARLFEGTSGRQGGAGVGLKHARAMARAAGGDLELVADAPGRGATFRVRWPRSKPPPAPLSAPRAAVLANTRVLIVEDDANVSALLESALGARGAEVVIARTAAELLAHADEDHDAALVDLSPIAQDVHGAVAALRRGSPDAILVFISGSSNGLPEGLDPRQVKWVRKPFEVPEIVDALLGARAARAPGSGDPM